MSKKDIIACAVLGILALVAVGFLIYVLSLSPDDLHIQIKNIHP